MSTEKKQYILEGLCCSNCAAKIEKDVRTLEGVKTAAINPQTSVLSMEFDADARHLAEEITRIAVSHDEDIKVKEALS